MIDVNEWKQYIFIILILKLDSTYIYDNSITFF